MSNQDECDKSDDSENSFSLEKPSSLKRFLDSEKVEHRRYWAKKRSLRSSVRKYDLPRSLFTLKNIIEKDESRSSDIDEDEEDVDMKDGWASAEAESRRYWDKKTRRSAMGAIEFPRGMYRKRGRNDDDNEEYNPALVNPLFKLKIFDKPREKPARSARWVKVGPKWVKAENSKEDQETSGERSGDEGSVADAYVSSPTRTAKITAKWKVTKRRSLPMRSARPRPKDRNSAAF